MILYGSSLSPFVRKTLAFAAEKGIELELRPTGSAPGQPSDEFLEASPLHKMPALRDGDYTLADSSAIIQFLEAEVPDPALIPAEPRLRGKTIWFEEFADTVACAAVGKIFFNRIVLPRFLGREGDLEVAAACERDDLPPMLDYLEKAVPGDEGFLVGDKLTLADIAVASPFANFQHCGVKVDPDRYPRTVAYVQRILARPSFSQWVERERAFLTKEAA
jgi:glutathione S-transferase